MYVENQRQLWPRNPSHTPSLCLHTLISGALTTNLCYPGDPGGLTIWVLRARALHPAQSFLISFSVSSCCSTPGPRGFAGVGHIFLIVPVIPWAPFPSRVLLAMSTESKDKGHMCGEDSLLWSHKPSWSWNPCLPLCVLS